jgi:hypothetical protein
LQNASVSPSGCAYLINLLVIELLSISLVIRKLKLKPKSAMEKIFNVAGRVGIGKKMSVSA